MNIKKINTFSEINLPQNMRDTLVLLDIDDTILSSPSSWGSVEQFKAMVEEAREAGYNLKQAKVLVYPRWLTSQSIIRTKLVDEDFLSFFEQIMSSGYVMGLTARQPFIDNKPVIATLTAEQLDKLQVNFPLFDGLEFNKKYKKAVHSDAELATQLNLYDDCETIYHQGILFCHDLNNKGDVFKDFFASFTNYCGIKNQPLPSKVIFVDDARHNLESMYTACTSLGLAYEGYHIQSTNYHFDAKIAKQEEKFQIQRSRSFGDFDRLSGWSL